jgi:hypothetical protein
VRSYININTFVKKYISDPAVGPVCSLLHLLLYHPLTVLLQNFKNRLRDHLLARIRGLPFDGDEHTFSDKDRDCVIFRNDRMFSHKVMRVSYTTYDLQRDQDYINPRTHGNIMLLASETHEDEEDAHPYWYAQVIGIYHVYINYREGISYTFKDRRYDFLWIRWYGRDPDYQSGFQAKRLPRLGFIDTEDEDQPSFGFLNPDDVIRAVHLEPAFAWAPTDELCGPTIAQAKRLKNLDYPFYDVNMCVIATMIEDRLY